VEIVRDLRLRALADAPDAFTSTLEQERVRTAADWRRWLGEAAVFVFDDAAGPAGLAAGVPHRADPRSVFLMSMWVRPGRRGSGAADALIGAVLSWARGLGVARVLLHVGSHNGRARRCYERNGFRATGGSFVDHRTGTLELEMAHELVGVP
jgi:GNAT superfamily N-acetyltransferase